MSRDAGSIPAASIRFRRSFGGPDRNAARFGGQVRNTERYGGLARRRVGEV